MSRSFKACIGIVSAAWFCLGTRLLPPASLQDRFGASPATLPVYIEESHAGSFYWLIENLSPRADRRLLLFDAHSDATEIFDSDRIRREVAAARMKGTLPELASSWRERGVIQSFNWIEPLLPEYFADVVWVAGDDLSPLEILRRKREAVYEINGHEETAPRNCGDLGRRYRVTDLRRLQKQEPLKGPVIASVDLDYFASCPPAETEIRLGKVLDCILAVPGLEAVTVAISTPYLASGAQADILLRTLLEKLTDVVNVRILYAPWAETGPDRSRLARVYAREGRAWRRFQIGNASPALRGFLLQAGGKIDVAGEKWPELSATWRQAETEQFWISVWSEQERLTPRKHYYLRSDEPFTLRLNPDVSERPLNSIEWLVMTPSARSYNLTGRQYGFADGAPRCLQWREIPVPGADGRSEIDHGMLRDFFDPVTGCGTVRIRAAIERNGMVFRTLPVCLMGYRDPTFPGRLTEIFNLPYILGSSLIRADGLTGPDAAYGADCAGFLIYGWRRMGFEIPYVNPRQLESYMEELDAVEKFRNGLALGRDGPIALSASLIDTGLLLHFGGHVAALFRDNPPLGFLDAGDLVAHQLEDYPQLLPLGDLMRSVRGKSFRVMRLKPRMP